MNQWEELLLANWPGPTNSNDFEVVDSNKLCNDSDGDVHKEDSKMFATWKESHL